MIDIGGNSMSRILKKTAAMMMAAAIGVSMNCQGAAVYAGRNQGISVRFYRQV